MHLVAIGAAKLIYRRDMLRFTVITTLAIRQARRSPGNLRAEVFPALDHYFSLTVWKRPGDMKRFATSGAHRHALAMADRLTPTSCFHHYWSEDMPRVSEALAAWRAALSPELRAQLRHVAA